MDLVRIWLRRSSGALGVSLLLPAIITVAATLAAAGFALSAGLGGLGTLGQLVSGPRPPAPDLPQRAGDTLAAQPSTLLVASAEPPAAAAPAPAGDGGGGATPGPPAGGGGGGGGGPVDGAPPGDGGGGGVPPSGGGEGGAGGGGGTEPAPGPLDGLDELTDGIVEAAPAPVGPLTGEAIDRVVDVGNGLLGGPRP